MLILTLFNGYLFLHLLLLHTLFTIQKYWPLLIHCYCIYSAHAHYISTIIHMSLQTTTRWCPDFVVHPWWFGASSWALNARWNVWLPPGISFYVLMWCVCWLQLCRHLPIYRLTCQYTEKIIFVPVVPARDGAEVALKRYIYIRPFSSIEFACAVRQRSPCVRALCETVVLFHMSHLKLHVTLNTWQSSHFTLRSSHCTLRSQHFTSHCTLKTPHFTLHTALFALQTSHFTVHTSRFTFHTSHCTLHALSHCTLHTPNFTLHTALFTPPTLHTALFTPHTSSRLSSSHLIPAQTCYVLLGYFHVIWAQLKLAHALDLLSTSARLSVTHVDSSTCQKA